MDASRRGVFGHPAYGRGPPKTGLGQVSANPGTGRETFVKLAARYLRARGGGVRVMLDVGDHRRRCFGWARAGEQHQTAVDFVSVGQLDCLVLGGRTGLLR